MKHRSNSTYITRHRRRRTIITQRDNASTSPHHIQYPGQNCIMTITGAITDGIPTPSPTPSAILSERVKPVSIQSANHAHHPKRRSTTNLYSAVLLPHSSDSVAGLLSPQRLRIVRQSASNDTITIVQKAYTDSARRQQKEGGAGTRRRVGWEHGSIW